MKGTRTHAKKKRRASTKFLAAGNSWRQYVKATIASNPGMKLKDVLKKASKTYKKPINVRNSQYSVRVRPRTRKAGKSKRGKRKTGRKKKSTGIFGF